jgi:hypothetical protein
MRGLIGYVDKHFVLHNPENPKIGGIGVQTIDKVSLHQWWCEPSQVSFLCGDLARAKIKAKTIIRE